MVDQITMQGLLPKKSKIETGTASTHGAAQKGTTSLYHKTELKQT
jgi:hypothetical protein